jgi:transposase InsO family protein
LYYYHTRLGKEGGSKATVDDELGDQIAEVFKRNRCVYGSRKIKAELTRIGKVASRRRICRIMKLRGLVPQIGRLKPNRMRMRTNQGPQRNILNRQFTQQEPYAVIVSDLTYVKVGGTWHYACILLDLHNREIVGYSAGSRKTAQLVYEAFSKVKVSLAQIKLFHTDRGNEFDNQLLDRMLGDFGIERSLSEKACPYDNAVAEAAFKNIKTEFLSRRRFATLEDLQLHLGDYINWYNHHRVHGALGYLSPVQYRLYQRETAQHRI